MKRLAIYGAIYNFKIKNKYYRMRFLKDDGKEYVFENDDHLTRMSYARFNFLIKFNLIDVAEPEEIKFNSNVKKSTVYAPTVDVPDVPEDREPTQTSQSILNDLNYIKSMTTEQIENVENATGINAPELLNKIEELFILEEIKHYVDREERAILFKKASKLNCYYVLNIFNKVV